MKKIAIIILVFAFIVPVMAQEITAPPAKASVEEFISYYQQREAIANQQYADLENNNNELESQISTVNQEADAIVQWTDDETALLNEFAQKADEYTVKKGDWLSKLAEYEEVYGKGNYWKWPVIYRANRDQISNPDLIYPAQTFKVPRVLAAEWKVVKGETLRKIANYYEVYYKDGAKRWKGIYEANTDKLANPNVVEEGIVLSIPRP